VGGFELGVDTCDEGLGVCDGEGGAERTFCPAFDGDEDWVVRGAGVEVVHPGFNCIQHSETDWNYTVRIYLRGGMYIELFLSKCQFPVRIIPGEEKC